MIIDEISVGKPESDRLIKALESIAGSLYKLVNPLQAVTDLPESPAKLTITAFKGIMQNGSPAFVQFVDLGNQLPLMDGLGNVYEGYTSLFRINGGIWLSSEIDLHLIDLHGLKFRLNHDCEVLEAAGVDCRSLRTREGESIR